MSLDVEITDLGDVLDDLSDVRWHIEMMELATRHNPEDEAKAFSAVIHTTLSKLNVATSKLEHLWEWPATHDRRPDRDAPRPESELGL